MIRAHSHTQQLIMSDREETQIASTDSKGRKLQMNSQKINEDETTRLIKFLEERECLWNMFCMGKGREKAYYNIAEVLEKLVEAVKVKINGLRA